MTHNKRILTIIEKTAQGFGLTPRAMLGRTRRPAISIPRMTAMAFAVEEGFSLSEVARNFRKRCHQTVDYAHQAITNQAETDPKFLKKIRTIWQELQES